MEITVTMKIRRQSPNFYATTMSGVTAPELAAIREYAEGSNGKVKVGLALREKGDTKRVTILLMRRHKRPVYDPPLSVVVEDEDTRRVNRTWVEISERVIAGWYRHILELRTRCRLESDELASRQGKLPFSVRSKAH